MSRLILHLQTWKPSRRDIGVGYELQAVGVMVTAGIGAPEAGAGRPPSSPWRPGDSPASGSVPG